MAAVRLVLEIATMVALFFWSGVALSRGSGVAVPLMVFGIGQMPTILRRLDECVKK